MTSSGEAISSSRAAATVTILERGAGLEVPLHREIAQVGRRRALQVARIEIGPGGQGEDAARLRLHDDHHAGGGVECFNAGGQFALGDVLDPAVDVQDQRVAPLRRPQGGGGEHVEPAVLLDEEFARLAAERILVLALQAFQSELRILPQAHRPQDVGRQPAVGVDPAVLLEETDAGEIEGLDLLGFLVADEAADVAELERSVHLDQDLAGVQAEHAAQLAGGRVLVLDLGSVHIDRIKRDAGRQRLQTTVEDDGPGWPGQLDDVLLLAAYLPGQLVSLEHLQVEDFPKHQELPRADDPYKQEKPLLVEQRVVHPILALT